MFYRLFRGVVTVAMRLFFRIGTPVDPQGALGLEGPVIFVGNHPNGLVDPGVLFVLARRRLTFLAKAPIFAMPVLGAMLRGLDALPVYRKQDAGQDMTKNAGTLEASVEALVAGRAISLFPEGRSHSEPRLSEMKTGCARIALDAVRRGARVRIVPVGIAYEAKSEFRSRVHVDVGPPLDAAGWLEGDGGDEAARHEAARRLTQSIGEALEAVTLNLGDWAELPVVETADALFALQTGGTPGDAGRLRAFARGMVLLREEQPGRFEALEAALQSFRHRLRLVQVRPDELGFRYRPATVLAFVARNLAWLCTLPVWLAGMALFAVPYQVPAAVAKLSHVERDTESTVKLLTAMLVAPLWWGLVTVAACGLAGPWWGLAAFVAVPPLALFTRIFVERRSAALRDARVFFALTSRRRLKATLLREGEALAGELVQLAGEFGPRL